MTYHSSCFYLCVDSPTLHECTIGGIVSDPSLRPLIDSLQSAIKENRVEVLDYFEECMRVQLEQLTSYGLTEGAHELAKLLALREMDNAFRGTKAAPEILMSEIPKDVDDAWMWKSVMKRCRPLNGGLWLSDCAHFCFNSLGFRNNEEMELRKNHGALENLSEGIRRFRNRELPGQG